jgi:hypothetical protein
MSKTLEAFLKTAGVNTGSEAAPAKPQTKTAAPAPATAAPAAKVATAKPAAKPPVKTAEEAKKDEMEKKPEGDDDKKKKEEEKTSSLTDAQKWLADNGVTVADPKVAEALFEQQVKIAEMTKQAEMEKMAEEQRALGQIFYQGMVKESTALRLVTGQATLDDVKKIAYALGMDPNDFVKRAMEMEAAVRSSDPALIGNDLGRAARHDDSASMQAAEAANHTPAFTPEGVAGMRQGVRGQDEKTMRFTEAWTLPGNPGLNHGQVVDQGKRL